MNIRARLGWASRVQAQAGSTAASAGAAAVDSLVHMVCDVCDLVGGPFPAAEAAHLRAIHDRLHHGITVAA